MGRDRQHHDNETSCCLRFVTTAGCLLVVLSPTEVQTGSSTQDPTTALAAKERTAGVCLPGNPSDPGNPGYRWTFGTGYRVITTPALSPDGQTLFVGSEDEHLYALDTAKTLGGRTPKRWDFYTPEGIVSSPAVSADNKAVFVGAGYNFYAVNAADGNQLWKFAAESSFTKPAVSESQKTVFVGSDDGNLYAVNAADGTLRWKFATGGAVYSSPAVSVDQKTVFVGSDDGNLYAVNAADGTLRWKFATGGAVYSSPAVSSDQEMVFVGCYR